MFSPYASFKKSLCYRFTAAIHLMVLPVLCLPRGAVLGQQVGGAAGVGTDGWRARAPVRTGRAAAPRVPNVTSPKFVSKLKADASDSDLHESRILTAPIARRKGGGVRKGHRPTLTKSLNEYAAKSTAPYSERLAVLHSALAGEPDSDLSPSLWLEAGRIAAGGGHFKAALHAFKQAWEQTKLEPTGSPALELAELALGQLAVTYMRTGMRKELRTLLDEIVKRPPHIASSALVGSARIRLQEWDTNPLASVECGVVAYNIIASMLGQENINRYTKPKDDENATAVATWGLSLDEEQSKQLIESGLSAELLQRRIQTVSPDWSWVTRTADHEVPVPCIAHLQYAPGVGHYSAVVESAPGKVRLEDPFLGFSTWMEIKTFNECASGFFLVPNAQTLPRSFTSVGPAQMENIFGRTSCPTGVAHEGTPCDRPSCDGMMVGAITDFDPEVAVFDRPITYRPLWGPDIDLTLEYRERNHAPGDVYLASDTSNFGPGWKHGLLSYISASDGAPISPYSPSLLWVTSSTYYEYANGNNFQARYTDRPALSTIAGGYRLQFSDGSQMDFTQGNAAAPRRYYLTRVRDLHGYELVMNYDSRMRLSSILDATGKYTVFAYTGTSSLIQSITDPFGRTAIFSYYMGRLESITDPLGLTSSIQHNRDISESEPEVVGKITTPYGDTTFNKSYYGLQMTDPSGYITCKIFQYHDGDTSFTSGPNAEPRPPNTIAVGGSNVAFMPTVAFYDHFHVSLAWNRKQWLEYTKARAIDSRTDPGKFAEITLWLQGNGGVTQPVPLAHKVPGQAAEWYNYPGQYPGYAWHIGSSSMPIKIARQTEDENGQVRWVMRQQSYTATGLPVSQTDEMGRYVTMGYNGYDVTSINANGLTLRTFSNHLHGLPRTVTEASGLVTIYQRNSKDQPTLITTGKSSNAQSTRMTYDADGMGTPDGQPGLLMQIEKLTASGWVTVSSFTYDSFGRVRTHTDVGGYVTTTDYDAFDRPTLVTHPDGSTEQLVYDRLDLVAAKDRAGRWTRMPHDAIQRPIATIAPGDKVTRFEWCSCGSLAVLTDPAGRVTEWKRDIQGRVTEKTMPDGVTKTSYSYQPRSARLASMTRPNDQGNAPTVSYRYFVDGHIQKEDYSDNSPTKGVSDVTYTYETGGLGRLMTVSDSVLGNTNISYRSFGVEGAGAVEFIDGPLVNDRLQFVYDWLDRISTENLLNDGDSTVLRSETQTWDTLGRPATVANALGTFTYDYMTNRSRPDSLTRPGGIVSAFAYNGNTAPGQSAGALTSIQHTHSGSLVSSHTYGYDRAGRMTSWQKQGSGMTASTQQFAYNLDDELIHAEKRQDGSNAMLDEESWALDKAGNWTSRTRQSGTVMETRMHNVMNRLTGIGGPGTTQIEGTVNEFSHVTVNGTSAQLSTDPAGGYRYRRTIPVQPGSNTVTVQASDTSGQVTTQKWQFTVSAGGRIFDYDSNGNTLSDGQRTMTWDVKDRLRSVTKGGTTWKWDYDYQDRRVREYENNTLTKVFVWSGTEVMQERNGSNTVTRTHYSGGFSDGVNPTSGTKYQTLSDHLGHVREVLGSDGTVATCYDYTSYQGPVKVSGTVEATFQTIGRYYHHAGSGLELAMYRAYDPELGRWISEDPAQESGGLNLYSNVLNSPVGNIDPLGLVIIYPSDPVDRRYVEQAIAEIKKTGYGLKLVNALEVSNVKHQILTPKCYHGNDNDDLPGPVAVGPRGSVVRWNPWDNNEDNHIPGGSRPAWIGLAHELAHSLERQSGKSTYQLQNIGPFDAGQTPTNEQYAVNVENLIRSQAVPTIPQRPFYTQFREKIQSGKYKYYRCPNGPTKK